MRRAPEAAQRQYPPGAGVIRVNDPEARWQTDATSLWVTLPAEGDGLGQVYLWGRDREFADDSVTLYYHHDVGGGWTVEVRLP